jgi:DNA-directed RNA polymerase specialized sigma24 family protein
MKTTLAIDLTTIIPSSDADLEARAAFDALVRRAWIGDRRALGTLAIAFGSILLDEARAALGEDHEEAAADVVQDLYVTFLERRGRWPPHRGTTVPWVRVRLREISARYRKATCGRK